MEVTHWTVELMFINVDGLCSMKYIRVLFLFNWNCLKCEATLVTFDMTLICYSVFFFFVLLVEL